MSTSRNILWLNNLPILKVCCGCIDIRTASAIIAVLSIVTCPAVSWAIVRHTYVVHVSCVLSTNTSRADVIDINFNNVLSFGYVAKAALGSSCLTQENNNNGKSNNGNIDISTIVKYVGSVVLIVDITFVATSANLLIKMYQGNHISAIKHFIIAGFVTIVISFVHSLIYVAACVTITGSFPILEFFMTFIDLIVWTYFLLVVNSFRRTSSS